MDKKNWKTLAGIIHINSHWFINDDKNRQKTFFLYHKNDKIVFDPDFRQFWEICIQPIYVCRRPNERNIDITDFKSNPRRCHPFATCIFQWYMNLVKQISVDTSYKKIPFLILKETNTILPYNWRTGLNESTYIQILLNSRLNGNTCLKTFQSRWRQYQDKKRRFNLCIQEIENEVAYRYGKYKMEFLKERFYSNANKKKLY